MSEEIAAATQEQAHGLGQINIAVSEMDKLTQQLAANTEESASAAEEMNAQAAQMEHYVHDLMEIIGGNDNSARIHAQVLQERKAAAPQKRHRVPAGHAVAKRGQGTASVDRGRLVRPEEILPLEEGEFKDF